MKTYGRKSLGKVNFDDTSLNFDLICRLCLTEDGEMKDLFQDEDSCVPVPLQIMASVSLAVYENDGLPMQVCQKCADTVEVLYKFKQKCEESDLRLRKIRSSLRHKEDEEEDFEDAPAKRIKQEAAEASTADEAEGDGSGSDSEGGGGSEVASPPPPREVRQLRQQETQTRIRNSMADLLPSPPPAVTTVEPPVRTCDVVIDLPPGRPDEGEEEEEEGEETIVGFNSIPVATEVEVRQLQTDDEPEEVEEEGEEDIQVQVFEEGEEEGGGSGTTIIVNIKSDGLGGRKRGRMCLPKSQEEGEGSYGYINEDDSPALLRPFVCQMCPKRFAKRIDLRRHLSVHQERKGFDCPTCDKWFPNQTTLKRHERSHTGERPYGCQHCEKSFSQAGILQRHIMTHTGVKPFVCDVCNKGFTQREGLKVHMRTHEPRSQMEAIQLHDCPLCEKSFCHPSGLSRHLLIHTGKTFKCTVCMKVFTDPSSLRRHLRRHEDSEVAFLKKE